MAKNRLAPLKNNLTIPRLELLADLSGKRMIDYIKAQLKIAPSKIFVWSDSKCVLSWIISTKLEKCRNLLDEELKK